MQMYIKAKQEADLSLLIACEHLHAAQMELRKCSWEFTKYILNKATLENEPINNEGGKE